MRAPGARHLQRGVIVLPSAFTVGNLFLGFWAIIAASRGDFETAGWLIVIAALLDMLDGRIARFTSTSSDFGKQLDSLVDAVSFGVAPALIFYFIFLGEGVWSWTLSFIYAASVIMRLARFNIEQGGVAKSNFHGLPSPTAGMTVATFYPFSQTAFFQTYLANLPWHVLTAGLILALSVLMVSHVLYPVVPRFSLRTRKGVGTIIVAVVAIVFAFTAPSHFFFPATIAYITYGLVRSVLLGFLERLPERDPLIDEEYEEAEESPRLIEYDSMDSAARIRRAEASEEGM